MRWHLASLALLVGCAQQTGLSGFGMEITGFDITSAIDVSTAPKTVTCTITATGTISNAGCTFTWSNGFVDSCFTTTGSGNVYECTRVIPAKAPSGSYQVTEAWVDNGDLLTATSAQLSGLGNVSVTVTSSNEDTAAPTVDYAALVPSTISTVNSPDITCLVTAEEDPLDDPIRDYSCEMTGPSGQVVTCSGWAGPCELALSSPEAGTWTLTRITANDTRRNKTTLTGSSIPGNPVTLTVTQGNSFTGLVGRYEFEDDCTGGVDDTSGNGNNGTCTGTLTHNPSGGHDGGGSMSFAGTANYITLANEPQFDFGKSFTIAAWVKDSTASPAFETILLKTGAYFIRRTNLNDTLSVSWDGTLFSNGDLSFADGSWHHIALTFDGNRFTIYNDGVQTGPSGDSAVAASDNPVVFGYDSANTSRDFDGSLDDVQIYGRALFPSEIPIIMAGGTVGEGEGVLPPAPTGSCARVTDNQVTGATWWNSSAQTSLGVGDVYVALYFDEMSDAVFTINTASISDTANAAAIVRFNSDGTVDAIDGNGYASDNTFYYTNGLWYIISVLIDEDTYSVDIGSCVQGQAPTRLISFASYQTGAPRSAGLTHFSMYSSAGETMQMADAFWLSEDDIAP